ncbi:DUF6907 domain-containing protein [Streptomyces lincolnensis]|uniref:DUF6907 domain-containing protein n=1 Tax=Streptomyces lincolnensis TaxID=1915 RepID=UPI0037D94ADD
MSEEGRAQRFVERHFPEVTRFLGQLPTYGPTEVFHDEDDTAPDVVVRVAYALSRGQLMTALSIGFTEIAPDRRAEDLTVEEVRREVEGWLHAAAVIELDRYVQQGQLTAHPVEAQPVMDALAAALDRSYPPRRAPEPRPVQAPLYGDGTMELDTLDHGRVTVGEPVWCLGHDGELVGHRADIVHSGAPVAAEFEDVGFLKASISWAPYGEAQPEPFPVADVEEFPPLGPGQLRELAAEVGLHAGRLYSKANELDRIRRGQA